MGKRTDIRKVLIIGSGPIIIGQACEFDYSGTQACKALRRLGYEIVLVNSNPATIMTDPATADTVYIEPLNAERLEQIIAKERPDALLPNLGGQSALNLSPSSPRASSRSTASRSSACRSTPSSAARTASRSKRRWSPSASRWPAARWPTRSTRRSRSPRSSATPACCARPTPWAAPAAAWSTTSLELKTTVARGSAASPVTEVLVEESILGWEELEFEVVRDARARRSPSASSRTSTRWACTPATHFCAAPMLTIAPEVHRRLQEKSYKIMDKVAGHRRHQRPVGARPR